VRALSASPTKVFSGSDDTTIKARAICNVCNSNGQNSFVASAVHACLLTLSL